MTDTILQWEMLTAVQQSLLTSTVKLHDMTNNPADGSSGDHDTVHDLLHAMLGVETDHDAEHALLDVARRLAPRPFGMTDRKFTHTFRLPLPPLNDMFRYRSPAEWVDDVVNFVGEMTGDKDIRFHDTGQPDTVTITAHENLLRLVCVLLNQHAEQSPSDPTPPEEGNRLEATLDAGRLADLIGSRVNDAVAALNDITLTLGKARFAKPEWLTAAVDDADRLVNGIQDYLADPLPDGVTDPSPIERQATAEFTGRLGAALTRTPPTSGREATGKRMLTVGEMREATKDDEPDRLITFYDGAGYRHLEIINQEERQREDGEPTVIVAATEEFDTRFDL